MILPWPVSAVNWYIYSQNESANIYQELLKNCHILWFYNLTPKTILENNYLDSLLWRCLLLIHAIYEREKLNVA